MRCSLGFDDQKESAPHQALLGISRNSTLQPVKRIREFRDFSMDVKPGT